MTDTTEQNIPQHLQFTKPGRGFKRYPAIGQMPYGEGAQPRPELGSIQLIENSLAFKSSAYIIVREPTDLNNPDGNFVEAGMLISMRDLKKFAEQCLDLCKKHYHLDCYGNFLYDNGTTFDDDDEEVDNTEEYSL